MLKTKKLNDSTPYFYKQAAILRLLLIILVLCNTFLLCHKATASGTTMIDFTAVSEPQNWYSTNDNVMGGISVGQLNYYHNQSQFQGQLSLANNGGFSSINRMIKKLTENIDTVTLSFLGDGRTYQLRLTTRNKGIRINYKHNFATIQGKRQTKTFVLHDFDAVFRGRLLQSAPKLKAKNIEQVGFLIADKQTQPFSLGLFRLQFLPSSNN